VWDPASWMSELNNVHESVISGKYEQALIPAEWETSLSQAVHQCLGTCRSPCQFKFPIVLLEDKGSVRVNRSFLSCILPLCLKECLCKAVHKKMCSAYQFLFTWTKVTSYERFCTRSCLDSEAQGKLETADCLGHNHNTNPDRI